MIGNNLVNAANTGSYSVYIPTTELWGFGKTSNGQLNNSVSPGIFQEVVSGSSWASASVGQSHTMAIKTDGTLWGWGYNGSGNIGDGTTVNRSSPVQIGTLNNWSSVLAGANYTVAKKTNGTLWVWGLNNNGELGTGNTTFFSSPIQLGSLTNWSSFSIGKFSSHTMAIKTDGTLWGWGSNNIGQLGLGTSGIEFELESSDQNWSSGDISIGYGEQSIILIKTNGTLWAWGYNQYGNLGDGNTLNRSSPVQIGTLSNWSQVSSGEQHASSIKTDGTLWSWGYNYDGVLGTGNLYQGYSSPIQVGLLTNWSKISSGRFHSAAIKTDGTLWTWGNNDRGQLGNGEIYSSYSSPIQIGLLSDWSSVYAGSSHTMAIKTDGTLWAWGNNNSGQLGTNDRSQYSSPIQVGILSNWSMVSTGASHTMAIKTDGTLWAWGSNVYGELGTNSPYDSYSSPIQIGTLSNWSKVYAGARYTMAIKTDGTLWGWGLNQLGQLGTGDLTSRSSPVQIGTKTNWNNVLTYSGENDSSAFTLVINNNNELYSSGNPTYFLRSVNYSSPVQIGTLNNWSKISVESNNTIALKTDGTLWAWGNNNSGQLGNNSAIGKNSPIQIGVSTDWSSVYAGSSHTMAIKTNGTLWAWGSNVYGELGLNDSYINRSNPTQVGIQSWKMVSLGANGWGAMSSAIKNDDTLWLWGVSTTGLFENGTTNQTYRSSPVQIGTFGNWSKVSLNGEVIQAINTTNKLYANGNETNVALGISFSYKSATQIGNKTNWTDVSSGESYTMAISGSGTLWGWGNNNYGQLGTNNTISRNSPVQVGTLSTWKSVKLGSDTSYAIQTNGTLWAWGDNSYTQLGTGDYTSRSSPVQVGVYTDWKSISPNDKQSAAGIRNNNTLWTWGNDAYGLLGQNTSYNTLSIPTQVGNLTDWSSVSMGQYHALAVKTDGTLWAWGYNSSGNLGTNNQIDYSSPVQVGTETNWKSAASGNRTSFASKTNGTLWAWGYNSNGALGLAKDTYAPNKINTDSSYTDISTTGGGGTLAIKADGTLWGWGYNQYGVLGTGNNYQKYSSPIQVGTLTNWSKISGGFRHTMATKTDGTLWGWGYNVNGVIGAGNNYQEYSSPIQIGTLSNWSQVSSGFSHTMAIKTDGTLWGWGYNYDGCLGAGNVYQGYSSPIQVGTLTNWSKISAGNNFTMAIKTDGTLWGWGNNSYRALGTGNSTSYFSPIQIGTLSNWSQISTDNYHSMAIKTDGTLWVWGENSNGNLGTGTTISYSSPIQLGTLTNWSKIYGTRWQNYATSVAIKTDGTLWAWGTNMYRFGTNTTNPRSSPVQIGTLNTFASASFGYYMAVGLTNGGSLYSWGLSYLGYDTNFSANRSAPTQIGDNSDWNDSIILSRTVGEYGSDSITIVIKSDGRLWGWGYNQEYQLGLGDNFNRSFPVQIAPQYNWISGSIGGLHSALIREY